MIMIKKSSGIDGMIEYLDYMSKTFEMVSKGVETIEVLVDLGRKLGDIPKEYQTEENRVPGCISDVYIYSSIDNTGRIHYCGSSGSLVVGGYVSILTTALDNLTPKEIVEQSESYIQQFLERTNLSSNLTPSRANALGNIYLLMKKKAGIIK